MNELYVKQEKFISNLQEDNRIDRKTTTKNQETAFNSGEEQEVNDNDKFEEILETKC